MTSAQQKERFGGIRRLYGDRAFHQFQMAHVCIIGVGGVGSWAVEALARSGVGKLTLIDLDDVCVTNINRQLHSLGSTVGQSKIEVMKERVAQINPDCQVTLIDDFITLDNIEEYISHEFDWVIDAIDSFRVKAALINYCKRNKIKILTTGGAGGQMDPTQVQVLDLSKTWHDPLAKKVRNQLRDVHKYSTNSKKKMNVPCVFSTEQAVYPHLDGSICQTKPSDESGSIKMDCASGFGAATAVTGTFGFVAASYVLQKLAAVA